jgi:hypothetical protein
VNKDKISNISKAISLHLALVIRNYTEVTYSPSLKTELNNKIKLALEGISTIMLDGLASKIIANENINDIYDALEAYKANSQKFILESLDVEQVSFMKMAEVSASHMILSFIKDNHIALTDMCFENFEDNIKPLFSSELTGSRYIATQINNILKSRVHYIIEGK